MTSGQESGRPLRVFVSSTAADLTEHRRQVVAAIERMGHLPVSMETFGARPGPPLDECRRLAASADVLVVAVAHRYGWVPPGEQKSITWLEVDAARAAGKPVLAFVVDAQAPWTAPKEQDRLVDAKTAPDVAAVVAAVQGLGAFRAFLAAEMVRDTFASPADLAAKVATALSVCAAARPAAQTAPAAAADDAMMVRYLREVLGETQRIEIRGISSKTGQGAQAVSYPIEELYTPLRTAAGLGPPSPGGSGAAADELRAERRDLKELLAHEPRLLLVGAPGSGKTTFLRLVACVLAKDALGGTPQRERRLGLSLEAPPPLPIFVRLALLDAFLASEPHAGDPSSPRWLLRWLAKRFGDPLARAAERRLDAGTAALLLDGLDEVVGDDRRLRLLSVVDAIVARWGDNHILVTSRPGGAGDVAGLADAATAIVAEFGDAEIREFVGRWVAGLHPAGPDEPGGAAPVAAGAYRVLLEQALVESRPVRRLARNPVMLTCLCVVHWNEKRLPEGKARLLAAVLRWLLAARDEVRRARGYTSTFAEECFKTLALAMTTGDGGGGRRAVADLAWAAEQLSRPFADELGVTDPREQRRRGIRFLEHEMLDSGIVERVGDGQLRYWHLTFQEHYAGRALAEQGDEREEGADQWWPVVRDHLCDPHWTEVLDHFAGELADMGRRGLHRLVERVLAPARGGAADLAAVARAVGVLGRLLRILKAYDYEPRPEVGWDGLRQRVLAVFTPEGARTVPWPVRVQAAEALGQGGDPRLDGPVEARLRPVPGLPEVWLGLLPVTVQEFRAFVDDDGYRQRRLWDTAGWQERERAGWTEPDGWEDQCEHPNRPVVGVSWYEAAAYGAWLRALTRRPFRLPTEAEWFAAARNDAGEYPWGRAEPTAEHANFGGHVRTPTPVGVYPLGAGPGGHLDLAGNVWEWCADDVTREFGKHYGRGEGDRPPALRALRGGAWSYGAENLRSAFRYRSPATDRYSGVGFRVAASPPSTVAR